MNKNIKDKIRNFVAHGRTKQAIDVLLQYRSNDSAILNEIISLSARYKNYLREKHGNLQDPKLLDIELNKINNSILHVIEDEAELRLIFFNNYTKIFASVSLIIIVTLFVLQSKPEIKTQYNVSNVDNSTNTNNYQTINQNTFIDKTEYNNCQIIHQTTTVSANKTSSNEKVSKTQAPQKENESDEQSDVAKAMKFYCNSEYKLALDFINKYQSPPNNVDLVFYYTLKGHILFFNKNYDESYKYLLLAFNADKNSKHLDLPKLRGLTTAYGHLKSFGYTLIDLKNIEISKDKKKVIYDLGFKKVEGYNGWVLVNEKEDNTEYLKLLHELKMDVPQPK
jgi:hypothetical protein